MTPQQQWRKARNAEIISLFEAGKTRHEITKLVPIGYSAVVGILQAAGHKGDKWQRRRRKTAPDAEDLRIISRYREGLTARETGEACGAKFQKVLAVLHRWAPEIIRPRHLNKQAQQRVQR